MRVNVNELKFGKTKVSQNGGSVIHFTEQSTSVGLLGSVTPGRYLGFFITTMKVDEIKAELAGKQSVTFEKVGSYDLPDNSASLDRLIITAVQ